jgi:hypothetical protein
MIGDWLSALEATVLARALRDSVWTYPLINAGHILGVALLVGAIVPLDLRLLGAWPSASLPPLWKVLTRTAAAGLVLAIGCGFLLFIARATEYAASSLFLAKMAVVGAGTANALAMRMIPPDGLRPAVEKPPKRVQIAGGVSLAAWLAALTLGRLVGYF